MTGKSTSPYLFGDLLALARQSWVSQMAGRLHEIGYDDYHRSDAATLRLLLRGPLPIGQLGSVLGITRQAASKLASGLARRGYARAERDARDSRRINIVLTPAGRVYAKSVVEVLATLNRELSARVDPVQLAVAEAVLRTVIAADRSLAEVTASVRAPG
ncbi:MAG: MarR family winged helix-turn-helix transcriptional regulator [Acidimicrobiales bacterium]